MKKFGIILGCAVILLGMMVAPGMAKKSGGCATIPGGQLKTTDGEPISPGYNKWGYNYQAHIFNGMYCDYHPVYRPGGAEHAVCQIDYGDVKLVMKWNDAWLSNKSCDGDDRLDRHYGFESYIGSGAWCTNHMRGTEPGDKWTYFCKIIAVPEDAYYVDTNENGSADDGETWFRSDGTEIGPSIWGSFAIIQEVESGVGATYVSPVGPGLGKW